MYRADRLVDAPIIDPSTHPSIGHNIQGPSLIRVPDWVADPLGRYLLYFADHKGSFIRVAHADAVEGPWTVHPPGSLHLVDSCFDQELSHLGGQRVPVGLTLLDRLGGVGQALV